jgi:hypothetical protein
MSQPSPQSGGAASTGTISQNTQSLTPSIAQTTSDRETSDKRRHDELEDDAPNKSIFKKSRSPFSEGPP